MESGTNTINYCAIADDEIWLKLKSFETYFEPKGVFNYLNFA